MNPVSNLVNKNAQITGISQKTPRRISYGLKSLITSTLAIVALTIAAIAPAATVNAAHEWQIRMSTPQDTINSRTFNLEYTTLSTDESDEITVTAYQDGSAIPGAVDTTTDTFGGSGAFSVTVPDDGTYSYHLSASSSVHGGTKTIDPPVSVTIDTVPPPAPSVGDVVQDGKTHTLTITVPSGSDVSQARIYSSTNPNFIADATTQVGVISMNPDQTRTFSYTASNDALRYHAVQLFDTAGNFSDLVPESDEVDAIQGEPADVPDTDAQAEQKKGGEITDYAATTEIDRDVGASITDDDEDDGWTWLILAAIILAGVYYVFFYSRGQINPFKREED